MWLEILPYIEPIKADLFVQDHNVVVDQLIKNRKVGTVFVVSQQYGTYVSLSDIAECDFERNGRHVAHSGC